MRKSKKVTQTLVCVLLVFSQGLASAAPGVSAVNVSLDQVFESPRWMFDPKAKVHGGKLIELLVEAKKALIAKDRARCLSAIQKAYPMGKGLGPWLVWNQMLCAQIRDKKESASIESLKTALQKVEAQPKWMLFGPAASSLKVAYVSTILMLAEQQTKTDRRSAWATIDKLQQVRPWLSMEERANADRWAGELAFVEQNLQVAQEFLQRSLSEKENADLRARIESIRTSFSTDKKVPTQDKLTEKVETPQLPPSPADLGMSDDEKQLVTRMNTAFESQDYVSAIEDGVQLLIKFPGSRRSNEASDRILDIYLTVSNRSEEKYRHVRESIVREMEKVDSGRLARWANNAYSRGNYIDALNLAEKSFTKFAGNTEGTKMLLLAGKSALACGNYSDAVNHFERLLKEAGGTIEATEATFRLGLLQYRAKKYAPAAAYFERLLALNGGKDFEYRALYWQWRAQQKIDLGKSAPFAQPLISKYPISYYGLRAQGELNGNQVVLTDKATPVKVELRFLDSERLAWERLNILLKAGWFKEAEKELDSLPNPQTPGERLVRAKLWSAALRYDLAVPNLNKALEENPELQQASILKIVFPKEYSSAVTKESKTNSLSEDWIRSLMRQESTFRPDAKSTSNALGLMQLLPATAQELVKDLKVKDFQIPESLFDPNINIKLGTTYLARMIKNFNNNVPLGVAAYNAGPTRLRRWLSARKDVSTLESTSTSSPEVELWIDELPWEETSFYVKAVLRNWMIYKLLEGSKLSLTDPIWLDGPPPSR